MAYQRGLRNVIEFCGGKTVNEAHLVSQLKQIILRANIDLANEIELQDELGAVLGRSDLFRFEREYWFSKSDKVDFYCPKNKIAIEVKIKGSADQILRQLERYAEHGEIKIIVLATAFFMGLPPLIKDKPAYLIHLSRAAL